MVVRRGGGGPGCGSRGRDSGACTVSVRRPPLTLAFLNSLSVPQRHATDVVSAVSFDYRGIDTLFEEFILFAAVAGVSVLLRPARRRKSAAARRPGS